ncbi:hypothetical protein FB451DRAFT_1569629 [Mycena latifolia]|nr:hypothetical protein FB451DRAFT_1569629 [Mycena latifolia]
MPRWVSLTAQALVLFFFSQFGARDETNADPSDTTGQVQRPEYRRFRYRREREKFCPFPCSLRMSHESARASDWTKQPAEFHCKVAERPKKNVRSNLTAEEAGGHSCLASY